MERVDYEKKIKPFSAYSAKAMKMLVDALSIDNEIAPVLEERMDKTHAILLHMNKNKQIMKNYQPYIRQMNGAFIDSKK